MLTSFKELTEFLELVNDGGLPGPVSGIIEIDPFEVSCISKSSMLVRSVATNTLVCSLRVEEEELVGGGGVFLVFSTMD